MFAGNLRFGHDFLHTFQNLAEVFALRRNINIHSRRNLVMIHLGRRGAMC